MSRYFITTLAVIGFIKICEFYNTSPAKNNVISQFVHSGTVRIINGAAANIRDYPYMASLQYNGTFFGHDYDHFCCGSIINEKWIITSAQCALARKIDEFHVRLGSSKYYVNGTVHNVDRIAIHPNYNELILDYDVALLEVGEKIIFNGNTKPINIAERNEMIEDNVSMSIAGWGAMELLGPMSDDLLQSRVQKINDTTCRRVYGDAGISGRMFCVYKEGYGPCVGDTGSPAVRNDKLIGLASWSHDCAYGSPTVYVKVSSVRDWIDEITMARH